MPPKFYLLACLVWGVVELRLLQSPRQIIVIASYKGKGSQEIGHKANGVCVCVCDNNKNETVLSSLPKAPLSVPGSSSFNS